MPSAPYEHHHGLKEHPFSIAPDPRFLYISTPHREALAHLLYGLGTQGGGIVLLTGPAGTGKTLMCRSLLEAVGDEVDLAVIEEAPNEVEALLASVCQAFGVIVPAQASVKRLVDGLNAFLQANHAQGRSSVLLIDGAQRLGVDLLEQVRLLTNLETHERKLLQVLLVGRPELQATIARHDMRQLAQRIVARCSLRPLGARETAAYAHHRLAIAGGRAEQLPARLGPQLHAASRGVPRTINLLCDRALLGASLRGHARVEAEDLAQAARELGLAAARPSIWRQPSFAIAAIAMLTICAAATMVAGRENYGPPHEDAMGLPGAASAMALQSADDVPPDGLASSAALHADVLEAHALPPHPRSAASAREGLLRRWGVPLEPEQALRAGPAAAACAVRLPPELRCVRMQGGLADLQAMGLPVVLHLDDHHGRQVDVLLSRIGSEALHVEVDGAPRRLPLNDLRDWWQGAYTVVWRTPPGILEPMRPGHRGPAVAWLRERLAQWRGQPAATSAAIFDEALGREVRAFQIAEGLAPDGIAGMKTVARLGVRTDPATPTLGGEIEPAQRVAALR